MLINNVELQWVQHRGATQMCMGSPFAPLLLIFCMTLMWQYGNAMLQLLQTVSGTPNREEYNSL